MNLMNKACVKLKKVKKLLDCFSCDRVVASSTFGLFFLGFYGIFVSHLPELVISNLNQEVLSLKQEKLQLSSYLNSLQSERENSIVLNNELNQQNRDLIVAYNSYLENISPVIREQFSELLKTTLDKKLDCLEKLIRLGYSYECLNKIQSIEDEIEKTRGSETTPIKSDIRFKEIMQKLHELTIQIQNAIPREWNYQVVLSYLRTENSTGEILKELLGNFRNSFSSDPKTGIDLVKGLELSKLSLLTEQDLNTLRSFITEYISQNSNIYKFPVAIKIMDYDSNEEIKKKATIAKKHVEAMILDFPAFETKLLEKINSLKKYTN